MIDSLLIADGLRTGRFTSPHVMGVTERITVNGRADQRRAIRRSVAGDRAVRGGR